MLQQERMRAIGELASGVAHDLNNVLNAVGLRLELIAKPGGKVPENVDAIRRIIGDAGAMVDRLQDFARQRRDRPHEAIDLPSVIHQSAELSRSEIEQKAGLKGAPVDIDVDLPELPEILGDATELRHVFINLLFNARDAMPRGGRIRICGKREGNKIRIQVADEGTGILAENLEKVFDPFFTTKGRKGTGLGLSMAYGVMSRLGGTIAAENRPRGGALFTLTFPIADRVRRPRVARHAPSPPPTGQRLLIIDDDPDNLEAMRELLDLQGQKVDTAQSGREALRLIEEGHHYDVVFCDVGMPEMNGWEVAKRIGKAGRVGRIYMLTGWAREVPQEDPRRAFVRGVLGKPIHAETLQRVLAEKDEDEETGVAQPSP
jgi:CheY-like chemotaxis protein